MRTVLLLQLAVGCFLAACCYGDDYVFCDDFTVNIRRPGDSGLIIFDPRRAIKNPCVMEIDACRTCNIKLTTVISGVQFCGQPSVVDCGQGRCFYMYMFDQHYMDETIIYPTGEVNFQSKSSRVWIGICHKFSGTGKAFNITYEAGVKEETKTGASNGSNVGWIASPFFPANYAMNSETYKYTVVSDNYYDLIRISFEDWHLSADSVLYFELSDYNGEDMVRGNQHRPVKDSKGNKISFTFHTGSAPSPGMNREFMGFRARYDIFREQTPVPKTDCNTDGYFLNEYGGTIRYTGTSNTRIAYDCLWVIKTQPGFDATYLKVARFKTNGQITYRNEDLVTVRSGLNSLGVVVARYNIANNIEDASPVEDPEGFYIRLTGNFDSSDSLIIVFNSVKYGECGPDLYQCTNKYCIDQALVCDKNNNCGDNSDEGPRGCPSGISSQHEKSYQYTITVGVIVPMVISVFLIMIICLLFILIRRWRRARLEAAAGGETIDRIRTLSEEVTGRGGRRRRRRRRRGLEWEIDNPPTYDEAMQNPPGWYHDVAFINPVDPTLPQPPSYTETIETDNQARGEAPTSNRSPPSLNSSQSELTVGSEHQSDTDSSSDGGTMWGNYGGDGEGRRGRRERHASSESERSQARRPDSNIPQNIDTDRTTDNRQRRKLTEKMSSKEGDNVDTCVIPDGPKPGMENESQIKPYRQQPLESQAEEDESQTLEASCQPPMETQTQNYGPPVSDLEGPSQSHRLPGCEMDGREGRSGGRSHSQSPPQKPPRYRDRMRQRQSPDPRQRLFRSTGNLCESGDMDSVQNGAMYKRNPVNRSEQNLTGGRQNPNGAKEEKKNIHRSTPNLMEGAGLMSFDPIYERSEREGREGSQDGRPDNSYRNPALALDNRPFRGLRNPDQIQDPLRRNLSPDNRQNYDGIRGNQNPERNQNPDNRYHDRERRNPNDQYTRGRRNQIPADGRNMRNQNPDHYPNRRNQDLNHHPNRRNQGHPGDRENPNRGNQNPGNQGPIKKTVRQNLRPPKEATRGNQNPMQYQDRHNQPNRIPRTGNQNRNTRPDRDHGSAPCGSAPNRSAPPYDRRRDDPNYAIVVNTDNDEVVSVPQNHRPANPPPYCPRPSSYDKPESRRPVTNERRPVPNERRPDSHERKPDSHERRPESRERRPDFHERRPVKEPRSKNVSGFNEGMILSSEQLGATELQLGAREPQLGATGSRSEGDTGAINVSGGAGGTIEGDRSVVVLDDNDEDMKDIFV